MKRIIIQMAVSSLMIGMIAASCNVTSHTEKAAGVNFSNYKTFAWNTPADSKKDNRVDNDILDNNIKNAVAQELEKKGWTETNDNPSVKLDYTLAIRHEIRRETEPVYSYPYVPFFYGRGGIYSLWYPYSLMGVRSYNIPFKEGELAVNMIDAKTNKLIWQGWAVVETGSNHVTSKEVNAQVKSIFRKFEPGNS